MQNIFKGKEDTKVVRKLSFFSLEKLNHSSKFDRLSVICGIIAESILVFYHFTSENFRDNTRHEQYFSVTIFVRMRHRFSCFFSNWWNLKCFTK